jgi:hypothetical protein
MLKEITFLYVYKIQLQLEQFNELMSLLCIESKQSNKWLVRCLKCMAHVERVREDAFYFLLFPGRDSERLSVSQPTPAAQTLLISIRRRPKNESRRCVHVATMLALAIM